MDTSRFNWPTAYGRMMKILGYVIEGSSQLTKHFDASAMDNHVRTFCLIMLDRLGFASEGIKEMLPAFLGKPKIEYSIGISIRPVMLDTLILMNAVKIVTDADDQTDSNKLYQELDDYCHKQLSEGLHKTFNYIDKIKSDMDPEKLSNIYSNLYNANSHYFETYNYDGTRPVLKLKAQSNASALHTNLKSSPLLKNMASIYEPYVFYSQYDHFGSMFYTLSRLTTIEKMKMMANAVSIFPRTLYFTTLVLRVTNPSNEFLKERLSDTSSFIDGLKADKGKTS